MNSTREDLSFGFVRAMAVRIPGSMSTANRPDYNITDGMEGDAVKNPDSLFVGQRLVNGWKNSGSPWTYELTPDRMLLPKAP